MDSTTIYVHYNGKWEKNDSGKYKFSGDTKICAFDWDTSKVDFDLFMKCIYRETGYDPMSHKLKISFQLPRFGKVVPFTIDKDKALSLYLKDIEMQSTLINVEVVEVIEVHPVTEVTEVVEVVEEIEDVPSVVVSCSTTDEVFFTDSFFQCNIVVDGDATVSTPKKLDSHKEVTEVSYHDDLTPTKVVDHDATVSTPKKFEGHTDVSDLTPTKVVDDTEANVVDQESKKDDHYVVDPDCAVVHSLENADGTFDDGSDFVVGFEFENKKDLKDKFREVAINANFETRTWKSDAKRYKLKCRCPTCNWMMNATAVNNSPRFKIIKYKKKHNCSVGDSNRTNSQTTSRYVAQTILATLGGGPEEMIRPKSIMSLMQNKSMPITYTKAWWGRKFANETLYGSPKNSYKLLPLYLHMLKEANSGKLTTHLEVENGLFKYVFIAFDACISGFQALRKVISVDGTFLKTSYKGVLLIATAEDGNFHQYPIAWAVVDSENNDSYDWFFGHLRKLIADSPDLVFISDRHASIANGLRKHYEAADHGHCKFHISQNLKSHLHKDEGAMNLFDRLANAYNERHFNRLYREFRSRFESGAEYLDGIEKRKWARAFFHVNRYNIMTTNGVESMNNVLKRERVLPIVALLKGVQSKVSEWRGKRLVELQLADNSTSPLTAQAETIIRDRNKKAKSMTSAQIGLFEFQVKGTKEGTSTHVVNLVRKTCTCRVFDLTKLPCAHALACYHLGHNIQLYDLCSQYYTREFMYMAYAETVYPVPEEEDWDAKDTVLQSVNPPAISTKRGRPTMKRFPSAGEPRKKWQLTCSGCGKKGHTVRTCKKRTEPVDLVDPVIADNVVTL